MIRSIWHLTDYRCSYWPVFCDSLSPVKLFSFKFWFIANPYDLIAWYLYLISSFYCWKVKRYFTFNNGSPLIEQLHLCDKPRERNIILSPLSACVISTVFYYLVKVLRKLRVHYFYTRFSENGWMSISFHAELSIRLLRCRLQRLLDKIEKWGLNLLGMV